MHFPGSKSVAASIALNTLYSITAPPALSSGCGKGLPHGLAPGGPSTNFTLNSPLGGGERRYLLHLPPTFSAKNNKPAPMILAFHGFGQPTSSIEEMTRLSDPDTNKNHIVVYPEGINNIWLGDPGAPNASTIDDRPFISNLLTTLESTLCIDTRRIYSTGLSNGGGLSGLLACYPDTSSRIAAFSGISAAYYTTESLGYPLFDNEGCRPGGLPRRIPYLHIHGDSDMVIAYDGNNSRFDLDENGIPDPDTLPIPAWLSDWGIRNGCPPPTSSNSSASGLFNNSVNHYLDSGDVVNSTTTLEKGTVERSTWTCNGWSDVVVGYYVRGLGHGWPSTVELDEWSEEYRLGVSRWNATAVLLEWFGRWSLGG